MENTPLIELKQVSQAFETPNDTLHVIDKIDLSIYKKEFVCVIGPSGCGKSTLLKMIAGYLSPTHGVCLMNGDPIVQPDRRRGVVFQSPTLYPWLTVEKNVGYGPRRQKLPKDIIKERTQILLEQIGLRDFKTAYPYELSGGMKQRVAIARVLANEPELMLMDEPFSALDAITRNSMQALLRKIWLTKEQTIFLITHDIEEALKLGTRVLVMGKEASQGIKTYHMDYTTKISQDDSYHPETDPSFQQDKLTLLKQIL